MLLVDTSGLLQMDISGSAPEYLAHLRDVVLYQGCVELVVDAQPTDESRGCHVVTAVVYFGSFRLEAGEVSFESFFWSHL